ncbi:MAG: hypothetical protein RH917_06075 [Lacipirellulaceae bacterium]
MVTEQVRNLHNARPFKPFTLHVADGDRLRVKSPEFMWMTPGGRTLYVSQGDEQVAILDMLLVTQVTIDNGMEMPSRSQEN